MSMNLMWHFCYRGFIVSSLNAHAEIFGKNIIILQVPYRTIYNIVGLSIMKNRYQIRTGNQPHTIPDNTISTHRIATHCLQHCFTKNTIGNMVWRETRLIV